MYFLSNDPPVNPNNNRVRPSSDSFRITFKRLLALLKEDETDEYGVFNPNLDAFKTALDFVMEVDKVMGDRFPKASTGTDEYGGIRLTWSKPDADCEVRLVCPAQVDQTAYIYHELGGEYAIERNASIACLLQWLEWFNQV
jgi:hypothetical protein